MPPPSLAAQLARAERAKKLNAALLTAPLFLFLLLTFLGPIGALLTKSFVDTDLAEALPRVTKQIKRWDGRALPDEATFAALIDDVRAARAAGTLAPAATRLNYDVSGSCRKASMRRRATPCSPSTPSGARRGPGAPSPAPPGRRRRCSCSPQWI